jgi:hypothetical protein
MKRLTFSLVAVAALAVPATARQLQTPTDWKWRTDAPAKVTSESKLGPDMWHFVAMPPGWHITMGPGGLLYPTGRTASGNFTLEAQIFLFPGTSQDEYGVFLGAASLDATATPPYLAFVARRDGQAAVLRRAALGFEPVVAWKANDAVVPHPGGDATARNVLRVEVGATDVAFSANGKEIAKVPRAGLATDGAFGFRVGKDLNLHISTLDVTQRLAPVPVKK